MMNTTQNTYFGERKSSVFDPKMMLTKQPESLFSLAMCDFDANTNNVQSGSNAVARPSGAFHPIEEYKDLSLKEILDLSDDFLFDDDSIDVEADVNASAQQYLPPNATISAQPSFSFVQTVPQGNVSFENKCDFVSPLPMLPMPEVPQLPPAPCASMPLSSSKKRQREVSEDDETDEEQERRFRPYQAGQWAEKFQELREYCRVMGHCLVPHSYTQNLPLARWVKRQRYQYKLMMEGKPSTMTADRVVALEAIGFIWDSQGAAWEERLEELRQFRSIFHHCNVPSNYCQNPQLATWVKCQRRQFKLHAEGKASNMTPSRIARLESLGFEWELRTYRKTKSA